MRMRARVRAHAQSLNLFICYCLYAKNIVRKAELILNQVNFFKATSPLAKALVF